MPLSNRTSTTTSENLALANEVLTKTNHTSFPAHGSSVITCLSLLTDGRIITGTDTGIISIHTSKGVLLHNLDDFEEGAGVWCMDTYQDTLIAGSTDRTIRVWDMRTGRCTHVFLGHMSTVRCLQIVKPEIIKVESVGAENSNDEVREETWPKQPVLISGSRDCDLRVWVLPKPDDAEYHPDLKTLPRGDPSPSVQENPYHLHHLEGHTASVRAISAQGRTCVSASFDDDVRVWDIVTGECKWVLKGHTEKVYSVALDLPRQQAYSGSMDSTVKIWDLKTGTLKHTLTTHTSLVGLVKLSSSPSSFSPKSIEPPSFIISGGADGLMCVFDPDTGALIHQIPSSGAITAFTTTNKHIISGADGSITIWDTQKGTLVKTLLEGAIGIWQLDFDGRRIVSAVNGSDDQTSVHVWELGGGVEL